MNVEFAFVTLFRMMLGDFDMEDLSKLHRRSAWLWFIFYMVLIYLVMLNMIMAVILDVYTEVKYWATGKNIESAWTTTYSIIAEGFLRRHWIPENELVEAFENEPKKMLLTEDAIRKKFPEIGDDQLDFLLELCKATHAAGTEQ